MRGLHGDLMGRTVIDARDVAIHPVPCRRRHARQNGVRGAVDIQRPDRVIKVDRQRPRRFRKSPLNDPANHSHLTQTQVRMDKPEGKSPISVGFSNNERDLMVVPVDGHRAVQGQVSCGEG